MDSCENNLLHLNQQNEKINNVEYFIFNYFVNNIFVRSKQASKSFCNLLLKIKIKHKHKTLLGLGRGTYRPTTTSELLCALRYLRNSDLVPTENTGR